jgi:hypothetical protein
LIVDDGRGENSKKKKMWARGVYDWLHHAWTERVYTYSNKHNHLCSKVDNNLFQYFFSFTVVSAESAMNVRMM